MLDVILDALLDSLKILPILLSVYFLIEFIEYKYAHKFENSKLLRGKWSPVFGALFGCVPQCGFSVVATDLFAKDKLAVGALIAVYISTSDEAIPIMLSNPSSIPYMLLLIGVKIILGIITGYLAMSLFSVVFKKKSSANLKGTKESENKESSEKHEEHSCDEHEEHLEESHHCEIEDAGCCHHHLEKGYDWKHPLVHSLKIFAFILAINLIFGLVIYLIGEDNLIKFLSASSVFQPLFAVIIGLIPNCASSVVLTELFIMGGLSFGSIVAGLSVNAGIAFMVLFKQNKNIKENLFILASTILSSLAFGYLLHFIVK